MCGVMQHVLCDVLKCKVKCKVKSLPCATLRSPPGASFSSFTSGSKLLFVHLFVHLFVQVLNIDTGEAKNSTILNDYAKHPNDAERHQDA